MCRIGRADGDSTESTGATSLDFRQEALLLCRSPIWIPDNSTLWYGVDYMALIDGSVTVIAPFAVNGVLHLSKLNTAIRVRQIQLEQVHSTNTAFVSNTY